MTVFRRTPFHCHPHSPFGVGGLHCNLATPALQLHCAQRPLHHAPCTGRTPARVLPSSEDPSQRDADGRAGQRADTAPPALEKGAFCPAEPSASSVVIGGRRPVRSNLVQNDRRGAEFERAGRGPTACWSPRGRWVRHAPERGGEDGRREGAAPLKAVPVGGGLTAPGTGGSSEAESWPDSPLLL